MAQEIKTLDGGEAPAHVRSGAHGASAKTGEGDLMQQSGGQAPTPGYVPDAVDSSKKAMEPPAGKDPEVGGVALKQ